MKKSMKRGGFALLLTLFFIIAITAAVGLSLKYLNEAQNEVTSGSFLVQNSAILEDILQFLKKSKDISNIKDASSLGIFLDMTAILPLEVEDLAIKIEISSKMGHYNINGIAKNKAVQEIFNQYLVNIYNVQDADYFMALLIDSVTVPNQQYLTDIFVDNPSLPRKYITNKRHFDKIQEYYLKTRHDSSILYVPWDELLRFDETNSTALDINYISKDLWQVILDDVDESKLEELSDGAIVYEDESMLNLSETQLKRLNKFKKSTFEPKVKVYLVTIDANQSSHISFDFNIPTKKVNNFEFEI